MSSIESSLGDNGTAPKSKMSSQAKVCLTACIGLFAVTAYLMLGMNRLIVAAWNFTASDWLQTAGYISAFAGLAILIYALEHHLMLVLKILAVVSLVAIPVSWYGIATYVANDTSHPTPLTLIIPMVIATILFAYCGSRHFSEHWGTGPFTRLITSFIAASAASLLVAFVPIALSADNDRTVARSAAEKAFTELHPGQTSVASSEVVSAGREFRCWIDNSRVRCTEAR